MATRDNSTPLQEIVALVGGAVAGNPTQYVVEKAFVAAGLDWRCLTFEVEPAALADAVRGARALGFRGFHCGAPHRAAIVEHLDQLSDAARLVGLVDCVVREQERLVGHLTRGIALRQSLAALADLQAKHVVLWGADGDAGAVALELAAAGVAALTVVDSARQAESLVGLVQDAAGLTATVADPAGQFSPPPDATVLIRASLPGGAADQALPLDLDAVAEPFVVADLSADGDTWLLREAVRRGWHTVDGLDMFVSQAALSFSLWTGREANINLMRDALDEFLSV